ncbi:hypothetical protein HFN89_01660 [Rhizobium laguerreae]|nr:hypothetical protein [Rhizobium laguerreae]
MKRTAIAILVSVAAATTHAEVFDPEKFGISKFEEALPKLKPQIAFYCEFLRSAVEGKEKVWTCSDGSTRFGDKNVWGEKPVEARPVVSPPKVTQDPSIRLTSGVLLTLKTVSNPEECYRSGKYRYCERFKVPTFSYALMTAKAQCDYLAPRLAARQYVEYRDLGVPVTITFDCEGNEDKVGNPSGPNGQRRTGVVPAY